MESTQQFCVLFVLCVCTFGLAYGRIGFAGNNDMSATAMLTDLPLPTIPEMDIKCREACQQKYSLDTITCAEAPVCMQCLDTCKTISNEQTLSNHQWTVRVASMIKQEFLVATHLAWEPSNELIKCLVTWEVFGGGLMGNLLTDSSNVELSLWPDTKYRVQVTCKNKRTSETMKSYPMTIDTTNAIEMKPQSSSETIASTTAPHIDTPIIDISTVVPAEIDWQILANGDRHGISDTDNYDDSAEDEINEIPFEYRQKVFENNLRFKAIVLGMVAAIIVFLLIVTMWCASRRDPLHLKFIQNSGVDAASVLHSQDASELLNEIVCFSNTNTSTSTTTTTNDVNHHYNFSESNSCSCRSS